MEAIRHIITSESKLLQITLPDNLVNEKLEVIILPFEETEKIKTSQTYKSLKGRLSKNEAEKMLESVKISRDEWQ